MDTPTAVCRQCAVNIHRTNKQERDIHLAANGLLVLLAALVAALVRFDAEAGPAPGASGLTRGTDGFLPVIKQLHQQVKLGKAARLQSNS